MTQESILWTTNGTGDGAADITQAQWIDFYEMLFLRDKTLQGVAQGYLNALAVSSTGNNNVTVASGGAVVRGFLYRSTAAVSHTVSTPLADTGFRVVLRADWITQTVRSDVVLNTTGVTDPPAVTQDELNEWEISLGTGTITSAGVVNVTSAPTYLYYNTKVNTTMIDDDAVTADTIAAAVAGDGLAGGAGAALSVNVDNSTVEISADALRIKALGVNSGQIANLAVTEGKLANSAVTADKIATSVAGDGLAGGGGTALSASVDGVTIEISADALQVKNDGVGFLKLGGGVAKKQYRYGLAASTDWDAAGTTIYDITTTDIVELSGVLSVVVANGTASKTESNELAFGFAGTPVAEAWIIDAAGEFCMVEVTTSIPGVVRQVDVTVRFSASVTGDKTVKCGWRVVGPYA